MNLEKNLSKERNIKLALGLVYLLIIVSFLYFLLSNFSYEDFTSYKFLQLNREYLISFKDKNILLISFILFVITIIWILLLGFGTPIALIGGFIFGKWLGTLLVVMGMTVGAGILYLISTFFFKDLIKNMFLKKFSYLEKKFKNNELTIMIIFRIIGLVPFAIANVLPVLFNIRFKNYFLGTMIGITPAVFIMTSLGSGFENIISLNNQMPSFISLITNSEIYIPVISFLLIIVLTFLIKKKF
jgi:uncharacterized membrane protein YdjX (TVP38/TMEM64 family)